MNLINSNDLISSGIGFSIINEDADFCADGELSHCRTLVDDLYFSREGENENDHCLCDTTELSDDTPVLVDSAGIDDSGDGWYHDAVYMGGRWAHIKDAHIEENKNEAVTADASCSGDLTFGAMQNAKARRERRVSELMSCIWRARKSYATRARVRNGVSQRYAKSVKLIVERKRNEWWSLYLTRAQRDALVKASHRPELARDYIPMAKEKAVETIPSGGWAHILAKALLTA